MKIVFGPTHKGFRLSDKAIAHYNSIKGYRASDPRWEGLDIPRDDPDLIQTIHDLGPYHSHRDFADHTDESVYSDDEEPLEIGEYPDEYAENYKIWNRSGKEMVYCETGDLIKSKLLDVESKINQMKKHELTSFINELIDIVKNEPNDSSPYNFMLQH